MTWPVLPPPCSVAMNWCSDSNGMASSRGNRSLDLDMREPGLFRDDDERGLGGVTLYGPAFLFADELRVVAQQSRAQALGERDARRGIDRPAVRAEDLAARFVAAAGDLVEHAAGIDGLHRHLILGERAGLVGADDGGAAERLDRGQLADDGAAPGHARHADGERDGDGGRQPLGDRAHGERDRGHEHLERLLAAPRCRGRRWPPRARESPRAPAR